MSGLVLTGGACGSQEGTGGFSRDDGGTQTGSTSGSASGGRPPGGNSGGGSGSTSGGSAAGSSSGSGSTNGSTSGGNSGSTSSGSTSSGSASGSGGTGSSSGSGGSTSGSGSGSGGSGDDASLGNDGSIGGTAPATYEAGLQFCTDEINRYRATVGAAPLPRHADMEQFALAGAQYDYEKQAPHQHFADSFQGTGLCCEIEAPGWGGPPALPTTSLHDSIANALMIMWNEGPGTPGSPNHHDIMAKADDAALGCGFYVTPGTEVPGTTKYSATVTVEFIDNYCTNGGSGSLCQ